MPEAEAHINVQSQEEIQVMIDFSRYHPSQFRQWPMPRLNFRKRKLNHSEIRIVCRITNQSQFRFGDPSYSATEPRWQSTIDMMEKSCTEQQIFKEGDSRVYTIKSYQEVEAHREAVYQETHREVNRDIYINQDSTEAAFRGRAPMMSTGWSLKQTSNDDYLFKQHLCVNATYQWQLTEIYSMKYCTKARESASALELVKYNHSIEAYVLDIDE